MTATLEQATDDIFKVIKDAWDPTTHKMIWPDLADEPPTTQTPWARTSLNFVTGNQASLHNDAGVARWNRTGFVIIQVFTPIGGGNVTNAQLGQLLLDAFEGVQTPKGVWFRNARYNNIGPSGDFNQGNVLVDFTFDEVK